MVERLILAAVAVSCLAAVLVWGRSARQHHRTWRRIEGDFGPAAEPTVLARSSFRKELHATLLYGALAISFGIGAIALHRWTVSTFVLVLVPVAVSLVFARDFVRAARLSEDRLTLERRAEEVLTQEDLAPRRWAARLAPEELPVIDGFAIGRVYQPGTGMMAGDFYDVLRLAPSRVAAVIGDVTGHGIDSSITAFQAKHLLRVFLRQYRDPAQALEELNRQLFTLERGEEFISCAVVVFDITAGTLRYASAGHPAAWLWHDREVRPLRSTGPLLMLDPDGTFYSREIPLEPGDTTLMYTDGLSEARDGDQFFGEERIANTLRRDPGAEPQVLCKSLLEAAKDFSSAALSDDVAIMVVRRS
ncbi:MAG TPA: PP2C family protein-serine/threonine phosphatase [Acidimicrobiales bacterium]|nr:PP2C family protein-serine/threonine phosphatase [Acidimicrobiales bacterium]